jgi:hypothetical protein
MLLLVAFMSHYSRERMRTVYKAPVDNKERPDIVWYLAAVKVRNTVKRRDFSAAAVARAI